MDKKRKMMMMNSGSYGAEVVAWNAQVIADGGAGASPTVKLALSNFITSIKAITSGDLWTYAKSFYCLHAGDLTTGRRNIINPATYRTTLSGTNTFLEANGTKSNGTSYIDQPLKITDWANAEINNTIVQYCSESSTDITGFQPTHGFETNVTSSRYLYLQPLLTGATGDLWNSSLLGFGFLNANHKARYITTYDLGNTLSVIYKNGSKQSVLLTSPSGTSNLAINRYILSLNNNGAALGFYLHYLAIDMVFSRAVTDAEAALLDTALSTYVTAAGLP